MHEIASQLEFLKDFMRSSILALIEAYEVRCWEYLVEKGYKILRPLLLVKTESWMDDAAYELFPETRFVFFVERFRYDTDGKHIIVDVAVYHLSHLAPVIFLTTAMYVFQFNIPWIINESEYNCSRLSISEWESRGSVEPVQGIYFVASGTIFVTFYIFCLIGMVRGNLLKTPCYCLMFFNGFIDITDIIAGSFFPAYFNFTGAVFCSSIAVNWFAGYFSWSVWCGASFNCVVLALNRVVEMIPSASFLRFLFEGKALLFWMILCVLYMAIQPFINRSYPYNTVISSYISSPMITDNAAEESAHFTALLVPIHNITVVVLSFALYTLICAYVIRMKGIVKGTHYKLQVQLFVQALLICTTTAITSLLYVLLGFMTLPRSLIIAMNIFWQLSHGLHGFIYFFFNPSIRSEVLGMFGRKKPHHIATVTAR